MDEYLQHGTLMGPNYFNSVGKMDQGGGGGGQIENGRGDGIGGGIEGGGGRIGTGGKEGTRLSIGEMMMRKLDQKTGFSVQHGFLAMQIGFWAKVMEKVEDLGSLQRMINKELEEARRKKMEEGGSNKEIGRRWLVHSQKIFEMIKFRDIIQRLISKNVK